MEPTATATATATPTPTPPPEPSAAGQVLVEYIRSNRYNAGLALLSVAVLFLVLTGYLAVRAFRPPGPSPADKPLAGSTEKDGDKDKDKPPAETEAQVLHRTQYNLGWLASLTAALVAGAAGGWLLTRSPAPDEAGQRLEGRVLLLALGGLLGLILVVLGCSYFYLWSESLTKWLNAGETKEARWVLIPLLLVVSGAGLIFLAIQPARAEERHNQPVRKLVYGANFALTVLLLGVALLAANVVFALKVPNKLDTTATGFYSLSDSTRTLLGRLSETVNVYAIVPDASDRQANDVRQLLLACEDAAAGKLKVRFLNEVTNRSELVTLQKKYPQLDLVLNQRLFSEDDLPGAVLLTTGEDEKRHVVIPAREFTTTEGRKLVFQGESRLFKELAFLADSETRPVVYFTQDNGELSLDPAPGQNLPSVRTAARFKSYLENAYFAVKPLKLTGDNPAVPDDADIVVVADPTTPFSDAQAAALRRYMFSTKKKGKLVVLAGANVGPDRKMLKTGLEPLLAELNVRLGTRFIYNFPSQQMPFVDAVLAAFSAAAEQNPILQAIIKVSPRMQLTLPREVEPLATAPGFQATDLMLTDGRTWTEDEEPIDLRAVVEEMSQTVKAQEARGLSRARRPLAVIVTEGATSRAVVFGCSFFVSDEVARRSRSQTAPLSFDLLGMSLDWLREKPSTAAVGIESKTYSEYRFPAPSAVDDTRLKYLPLGLALLAVVGLGAGVWVTRRR